MTTSTSDSSTRPDSESDTPPAAAFPATYWSRFSALRAGDSTERRDALDFLLRRYWKPVSCCLRRRGPRVDDPATYHAEGILYLSGEARFDYLLNRPEAGSIGAKVNAAMRDIEKDNPQLAGFLPKTYNLFTSSLLKELLKKVSEIPASLDYDTFGRICEYFLGEFAMSEGQGCGEFYTLSSIVRLLSEVIEPYHGRILDPACGSGGMFVSSARFVSEHKKNPAAELSIHGAERTDETGLWRKDREAGGSYGILFRKP
jgi:type I restriction enzyme M protein